MSLDIHCLPPQVCEVDDTTARAVCRELGHPYGRVAHPWGAFGPGTGAVAVRRIECPAGAASLSSCDYSLGAWDPAIPWTCDSPCWHGNDVSIECFDQPPGARHKGAAAWLGSGLRTVVFSMQFLGPWCSCPPAVPVTGIRLVNGTASSGRLEVQVEGYGWGTVRGAICVPHSSSPFARPLLTVLSGAQPHAGLLAR